MSIIGEEDLAQDTNIDLINEIDKEILKIKCPDNLMSVTEEDVSNKLLAYFPLTTMFMKVFYV